MQFCNLAASACEIEPVAHRFRSPGARVPALSRATVAPNRDELSSRRKHTQRRDTARCEPDTAALELRPVGALWCFSTPLPLSRASTLRCATRPQEPAGRLLGGLGRLDTSRRAGLERRRAETACTWEPPEFPQPGRADAPRLLAASFGRRARYRGRCSCLNLRTINNGAARG